jgi:putative hemolysin
MKDTSAPTLGLALSPSSQVAQVSKKNKHQGALVTQLPPVRANQLAPLEVFWAQHLDQVRSAQRLRYNIFFNEMGARLNTPLAGHDIDRFDDFCEHLLVREPETCQVIGTYRLLTPAQARRAGGLYTETEFHIPALALERESLVELGRSCVRADHRNGPVILALWAALARFMASNRLHTMIGCASVPLWHQGHIDGLAAASIWLKLAKEHACQDPAWKAVAHTPLPISRQAIDVDVEPPALIKGYLRLGAKVLGAPAWDPDFNTADLPMLMRLHDLPPRYQKHFLADAHAQA